MTLEETAKQIIQQVRALRRADRLVIAERNGPAKESALAIKKSVYRDLVRLSEQHELAEARSVTALEKER